jgi:hemerythrin
MDPAWSNGLKRIGIEEHNREHREILETIEAISMTLRSNGPTDAKARVVQSALENVSGFLEGHFVLEEILMQRSSYPAYASHKYEHDLFRHEIGSLRKRLRDDSFMPSIEVLKTLSNWLHHHILELDTPLVPHLILEGMMIDDKPHGESATIRSGQGQSFRPPTLRLDT